MSTVSITNLMQSALIIPQPKAKDGKKSLSNTSGHWTVKPGETKSGIDKAVFDALVKGNPALKAFVDMKRIRVQTGDDDTVVPPEELTTKTTEPEMPPDLKGTADSQSMDGKVTHKTEVETVVEAPAPIEKPPANTPKKGSGRGRKPAAKPAAKAETQAGAQE